jgi:hypothetical protein
MSNFYASYPVQSGGGGGAGNTYTSELRTVTAPEATAKSLVLAATPITASGVIMLVASAPNQFYGLDFTVSGTTLTWAGLGLDGILAAGDQLTILYPN